MFCSNCGKPIDDGRDLCDKCAAASGQNPVEVSSANFTLNTSGEVHPKKSKKGLVIGVAAVAVAAAAVALLWNPIASLFGGAKKFDTPQEHFAYVESESLSDLADSLTGAYGDLLSVSEQTATAYEADVHIQLGDNALSIISAYMGADVDLSWLSDIMLGMDVNTDSEMEQVILNLGLGDTSVMSADIIVDASELVFWLAIPELSNTYIELDMQSIMEDYYGASLQDYSEQLAAMQGMMEVLPKEQVVNKLLNKYVDIVLAKVTDIESTTETITVDGISEECTVLTATIDEKTMIEIAIAVLNEVKNDDELLGIIEDVVEYFAVEVYGYASESDMAEFMDMLQEEIDDMLEELQEELEYASEGNYIRLIDYVDKKNNIIGRRLEVSDEQVELYYMTAHSGDQFAFEAVITDSFDVAGKGTEKSGKVNAEYVVTVEGVEFLTLQVEDFDNNKLDSGYLSGTLRLIPSDDIVAEAVGIGVDMEVALELVLDTSETKSSVGINILIDNELFAGITVDAQKTSASKVTAPANAIDPMDEDQLIEWISGWDFDQLIKNLDKAGLPDEYLDAINGIADMIEENMSYYN